MIVKKTMSSQSSLSNQERDEYTREGKKYTKQRLAKKQSLDNRFHRLLLKACEENNNNGIIFL